MEVMTSHNWFDTDVEKITLSGHGDTREIKLRNNNCKFTFYIHVKDVIELAKEFDLAVCPKNAVL